MLWLILKLSSNRFEGMMFPSNLTNLDELQILELELTSLTNSTHLNFLAIDGNMLKGVIPETIGNLSKELSILYMGENHFNGSISSSIGCLRGLKLLNLSYNSISGDIPKELGQLEKLFLI